MRNLVLWLMAAVLATFGLVNVSAAPASAIECPYTGCVRTITVIKAPAKVVKGSIVPIRVTVLPRAGTANPRGTLDASCSRPGKTKSKTRPYRGDTRYVFFKLRKKAFWTCEVKFSSPRKFRKSSDSTTVRVVRR
jgi:hypothetical protein